MSETRINQDTGEVIDNSNSSVGVSSSQEEKQERPTIKFNGMFSGVPVKPLDLSNSKQEQFEEIPPFTKDADGKWLNDTSQPKLISKGFTDVDEYINSFKDDVDIYKLLEKIALTGDWSLANQREGFENVDTTKFPSDIHEAVNSFSDHVDYMRKNFTKEEIQLILSDTASVDDVVSKVNDRINGNKKDLTTTSKEEVVTEEKKEVENK